VNHGRSIMFLAALEGSVGVRSGWDHDRVPEVDNLVGDNGCGGNLLLKAGLRVAVHLGEPIHIF